MNTGLFIKWVPSSPTAHLLLHPKLDVLTFFCKVMQSSDVGPKKVEVARYVQANTRTKKGVLVLDSGGIDMMVGILTICAVLSVKECFTR